MPSIILSYTERNKKNSKQKGDSSFEHCLNCCVWFKIKKCSTENDKTCISHPVQLTNKCIMPVSKKKKK